jgi:hypothetical protein
MALDSIQPPKPFQAEYEGSIPFTRSNFFKHFSHCRPAKQQFQFQPLEVRFAPARTLHDRAFLVDGERAWTVTQSLKDLAKRSPAEIVRADDTAALKIAAYEQIWSSAKVVV